ncbi:AbfB domain-containing protein [Zobellia galactanivorans]|uniref:AbfB domain-containing protein n=1 Tax=Zobellia galactanivorans (strain DSM 12802 / CCUG 47099 / CIP 106680 / NCIMB 13871 / Dsij) TaxID=63186 RepID=UPI0026E21756|nr:AbfB domain-containing protein [Zobellia galactanivorans]MDO6810495.1 AbfB domain-containing protein [Zobellia galactanivorans]
MKNSYTNKEFNKGQNGMGTPMYLKSILLVFIWSILVLSSVQAQVGQVLWEDNFDTFDESLWTPDIGDGCAQGICGWGNQELQSYESDNVYIEDVPGEPGNKALVIEAKRENSGSKSFTSGKVTTNKKVAIHYGLIEVRVRVPDLQTGLWPAVWLLGTSNLVWPAKGEIDMMEMGFNQEERTRQLEPNSTVNTYTGANAFFPIPDNGGVGNIAYEVDYNTPYVADRPLNDRFVTYKLYWEPTSLRFVVEDDGTEYDLYAGPLPLDPEGDTAAFTRPFYMLLNLAVGGSLTGVLDPNGINAPLPGKMMVDYVRVSEYNGHGSVEFGDGSDDLVAESGNFGVFTENTPVANGLNFGSDADIFVFSDTFAEGSEAPYEGEEVISWETSSSNTWFGAGITSLFGKNMSNYVEEGTMKFKIKIPADVSFRIGITDNFTNEKYITFPAGETKYGLVRNGEWGQVEIPLSDFEGLLAFQNLSYLFIFSSDPENLPSSPFAVAIDDIVWEDGSGLIGCQPSDIIASADVNGDATSQTNLTVGRGDSVSLNPGPAEGTWSWSGPNNFSSNQRQVDFLVIGEGDGGSYTGTYTNGCGAETTITYRITIDSVTLPEPPVGVIKSWTSVSKAGNVIRHLDGRVGIASDVVPVEAGQWNMVAGLAGSGVSFQSVDFPNKYLRHRGGEVWLDDVEDSALYREDATFFEREGLADASATSFESFNYPGYYLQHRNSLLYIDTVDTDSARNDATFTEDGQEQDNDDNGGCSQLAANNDYTVEITENEEGSFLTFVPENPGIGNGVTILYYGTVENGIFPGYSVTPNEPKAINAELGQTVYFFYTYNVPEGGERNTSANRHSFEVGSCATAGAMQLKASVIGSEAPDFFVYPNPVQDRLQVNIDRTTDYHTAILVNGLGQELDSKDIKKGESPVFEMASLPRGVYFIRMIAADRTETAKVIK